MKEVEGVYQIEKSALQVVDDAVELFMTELIRKTISRAKKSKETFTTEVMLEVVNEHDQYDFLRKVSPKRKSRKRRTVKTGPVTATDGDLPKKRKVEPEFSSSKFELGKIDFLANAFDSESSEG